MTNHGISLRIQMTDKMAKKRIVHAEQSTEREAVVGASCANCVEPTLELSARSRTRPPALMGKNERIVP